MADLPIPIPKEVEYEWIFSPKEVYCLKDLASDEIVQILWREKIEEKRLRGVLSTVYDDEPPTILSLEHRSIKITWDKPVDATSNEKETISAPLLEIQSAMQDYACFLKQDCKGWEKHVVSYILLKRPEEQITVLDRFANFIYDSAGFIDDVRTARKMISSGRFNAIDSYAIACSYCFEEEIQRLWPLVSKEICDIPADEHYLVYYWTHVMMNETEKLSSASTMFINSYNVSAMQFFFDKIDSSERKVRAVGDIFGVVFTPTALCTRTILPKQSDEFFKALVGSYPGHRILPRLIADEYSRFYVLPFWMRTRDFFTGDVFVNMFLEIINDVPFYMSDPYSGSLDEEQRLENIFDMYIKVIWDNSPEQLKQFAMNFFQFQRPDHFAVFNSIVTGNSDNNA